MWTPLNEAPHLQIGMSSESNTSSSSDTEDHVARRNTRSGKATGSPQKKLRYTKAKKRKPPTPDKPTKKRKPTTPTDATDVDDDAIVVGEDDDEPEIEPLLPLQDISKHLRRGMRKGTTIYLTRRGTDEQTARRICDRILNSDIRKHKDFPKLFAKKWTVYKTKEIQVQKKKRRTQVVREVVHLYSRILSQLISDIKKNWFEFDGGEPATHTEFAHKLNSGKTGNFWATFVELTRRTFPSSTTMILYNPNTGAIRPFSEASARLKEAWNAADQLAGVRLAASGTPPFSKPFLLDKGYPAYAAFCVFYSSPSLLLSFKGLERLVQGEQLKDLVTLQDRAFLLNVYAHLCCGFSMEAGWYFSEVAFSDIAHIAAWMRKEDQDTDNQKKAAQATTEYMGDIVDKVGVMCSRQKQQDGDFDMEEEENSDN